MAIGIYGIINHITGTVYIGQSTDLQHRETEHFWALRNSRHHCKSLQRSFLLHGPTAFEFVHLEPSPSNHLTLAEQFWMDYFRFMGFELYNTRRNARSGYRHTPESKQRQSKAMKGRKYSTQHRKNISEAKKGESKNAEWRAKLAKAQEGKKLSDETKAKMSASRTGMKHSEEAVQKRVKFHTGRKRSPETCKRISEAKMKNKEIK